MSELKKTSLYHYHQKLSAHMAPFAGWEMPIQYQGVKAESIAVRKHLGVFDVSHMGEFFITGKQAVDFVDYIMTNDFASLDAGKAIYSPICDHKGFIIDDLIAYKISEQQILICVNAANTDKDWDWFQKIINENSFDCSLENVSENFSLIALQGPESYQKIKNLTEFKELQDLSYYGVQKLAHNLIVSRTGYTGEDGFEIFCDHDLAKDLWQKFIDLGALPCGLAARDVLRLEVGYPLYGNELNQSLTPLDTGLKWTTKLNKKIFIGLGALKNYENQYQLIKLSLDKLIPRAGYLVRNSNQEKIGTVTSGTLSPNINKGIAMARIEKSKMPIDNKFYIEIRSKNYIAEYQSAPFIKGSHKK